MSSQEISKVLYLDQKCWINLAKVYFGKTSEQENTIIDKLLESSEKGQIIFPLAMPHIDETTHIANDDRRKKLTFLMVKMSNGYSLQPDFNRVLRAEIRNFVLRKLGLNTVNIRDYVLKKGISNLFGAKATLVPRKGTESSELPEDVKNNLMALLDSPEALKLALMQSVPKSLKRNKRELVKQLEKNRQELSAIKDKNYRKRVFFARSMIEVVLPELEKISNESTVFNDFFKTRTTKKDVKELLDNLPTANCLVTLIYRRDSQLKRPIKVNDFNDIWFLTLAIPYCDIVVTNKEMASMATQAKLDEKCKTIILSSIHQLEHYLNG